MKNTLFMTLAILLLVGCGGAKRSPARASLDADRAYQTEYDQAGANMAVMDVVDYDDAPSPQMMEESSMDMGRSSSPRKAKMDSAIKREMPSQQPEPRPDQPKQQIDTEKPMVVYNGYLRLRVRRLLDAVDEISAVTKEKGGYVESMSDNVVVVRIPGDNFEEMMETFAKLGDLLDREISAVEVTQQFTDLSARLTVAEQARERLLKLLQQEMKPKKRLAILQEIKRLSEQIESIKSTLATLQNLLDYFTITIDLEPIIDEEATTLHQSPFPWIRELRPHRTTLYDGRKKMKKLGMKLPADFVLFDEDDNYRAQAADTSIVRGGIVNNNPHGDNTYWMNAIHYEMTGRGEEVVEDGEAGMMQYQVYKNNDITPRWYMVAVVAKEKRLYVVEVFFPTEEAFKAHYDDMVKALQTIEVD